MRPASIIRFEQLFLGALAADLLAAILALETNLAALKANPATAGMGAGALIGMLILYVAFALVLWFFAARRRSVVAKWLLSIWFIVSTCGLALSLFQGQLFGLATYLGWVAYGLRAWSVSYLFKPDADTWFAKDAPSA